MKTLYISDLDGTILNSNTNISDYTASIINKIIENGHYFSYATARSFPVSHLLTSSLNIEIPIISHNGVFLINPFTQKTIISNFFNNIENSDLIRLFNEYQLTPNVYSFIDGVERVSLIKKPYDLAQRYYLDTRKNDKRLRLVNNTDELYMGNIFYYLCMGDKEKLQPIHNVLNLDKRFNSILSLEHEKIFWLDIMPKNATKANAILKLKEILGCNKIISFGDGLNDIPMFKISDECYAVENAVPELKAIATGVIDSNENNGVAKWLSLHLL